MVCVMESGSGGAGSEHHPVGLGEFMVAWFQTQPLRFDQFGVMRGEG